MDTYLCDMNAISLTNLGDKFIADFKKEFVIYDVCGKSMKPLFKSDFGPKEGRILGGHSEEYPCMSQPEHLLPLAQERQVLPDVGSERRKACPQANQHARNYPRHGDCG